MSCLARPCAQPQDPANGWHTANCYSYTCHAFYTCADGYELVGRAERVCQADGTWAPKDLPTCVRKLIHFLRDLVYCIGNSEGCSFYLLMSSTFFLSSLAEATLGALTLKSTNLCLRFGGIRLPPKLERRQTLRPRSDAQPRANFTQVNLTNVSLFVN